MGFYVGDRGMGMGKNKIKRVFEGFVKVKCFVDGRGLGLCMRKRMVEEVGGSMGVESEWGKGGWFWFRLGVA